MSIPPCHPRSYIILNQGRCSTLRHDVCRDSDHWLRHFPPLAMRDLTSMGCGIDWRRSFITTDRNPFYDSFVRWQFELLRRQGRVVKDKRCAITFCTLIFAIVLFQHVSSFVLKVVRSKLPFPLNDFH